MLPYSNETEEYFESTNVYHDFFKSQLIYYKTLSKLKEVFHRWTATCWKGLKDRITSGNWGSYKFVCFWNPDNVTKDNVWPMWKWWTCRELSPGSEAIFGFTALNTHSLALWSTALLFWFTLTPLIVSSLDCSCLKWKSFKTKVNQTADRYS